jgi:hypothetical protein
MSTFLAGMHKVCIGRLQALALLHSFAGVCSMGFVMLVAELQHCLAANLQSALLHSARLDRLLGGQAAGFLYVSRIEW